MAYQPVLVMNGVADEYKTQHEYKLTEQNRMSSQTPTNNGIIMEMSRGEWEGECMYSTSCSVSLSDFSVSSVLYTASVLISAYL